MSPAQPAASAAARLGTLLRTIRPLRPAQALAQLRHALFGVAGPRRLSGPPPVLVIGAPATPFLPPPAHVRALGGDRFELLGTPFDLPRGAAWSRAAHGPLFAYHLHQHEYLRRAELDAASRARAIGDWIASHRSGVGWDPHPLGLRLVAWGKLLTTAGALPDAARDPAARAAMLASFADQAETLAAHLEIRLQANHLLSNLLCLVFAGLLVEGSSSGVWRAHADRLVAELDAQVHPDGGHEERSPMYHAVLLEGVLDLLNLCRAAPGRAPAGLESKLVRAAARMLRALAILSHPDGRIALFADSAFDVAAEPDALRRYAERLGVEVDGGALGSARLPDTGYVRLAGHDWLLIVSAAGPAPAHQPGHAHCDALAFELSIAGRRLVADTGVFEYVPGERRRLARATESHATLQIDGEEQAEIWSAHRVGGRPVVALTAYRAGDPAVEGGSGTATATADAAGAAGGVAEATCRGWSRPATLHRRRFEVAGGGLTLVDSVEGPVREIRSRIPIAPGWEVRLAEAVAGAPRQAICRALDDPALAVEILLPADYTWSLATAPHYPRFGVEIERPVLVGFASAGRAGRITFRRIRG